jgi:hypothetical protein
MTTCPVCEHVQPSGDECEVCGRKLALHEPGAQAPGEQAVPRVPGLEPTLHEPGASAPGEPVAPLPDLEPTRLEAGAPAPAEPGEPWIEGTRAAAVGAIPPDPVPDLEHHRAESVPDVEELPREGPVFCRYCRTPAAPNDRFCGRCGMRLSRFEPVKMALAERGEMVCPDCGAMGPGPRCRRCGGRMVEP